MCCERLVCAACSGQVVEAGCGVCAAAKSRVHPAGPHVHVPEWLAVVAVLLVTLAVLASL
ncbi:MAG TPA: hypothetical protein VNA14_11650 [Mycobacteriales bacterium]|nr:hypothetical protein [Mycobacteriales bacterium]